MSATLAACLIVRNGAETIARALASIRPHVGEVCVLDTGSTDGTLELLADLAAGPGAPIRVQRAAWHDDYARARDMSPVAVLCPVLQAVRLGKGRGVG